MKIGKYEFYPQLNIPPTLNIETFLYFKTAVKSTERRRTLMMTKKMKVILTFLNNF